jgi:site-specific recombinase
VWALRGERPPEDDRPIRVLLDQCRAVIRRIRRQSGRTGVTVALTYKLHRLDDIVDRLELLLDLADHTTAQPVRGEAWLRLLRRQIRACGDETSLRAFWRDSTQLAALQITEHAGRAGDHYIAADRSQWWSMLRSAMIGGAVIGAMAIVKILIGSLHAPLLVEGALVSLNYGLGFVLIHLLHGTVATKQPAMTAARIAAEIGDAQGPGDGGRAWLPRVVDLLVQVVRSQLVAVAGNIGVALPMAALITWASLMVLGVAPATPEKAALLLRQLDPLGLTLFYAAIAGVCLFLSGVISGYCDNLAVFHRLPRRVARMPLLVRAVGAPRAAAVGAYVEHNFGALVGNFVFGCMLGSVTLAGAATGLPLDIRHVAFSSANLGVVATLTLPDIAASALALGALGVLLIAVVNLMVSFTLSLMLALRARRLRVQGIGALWRAFGARLLARPFDLLRPPPRPLAQPAGSGD